MLRLLLTVTIGFMGLSVCVASALRREWIDLGLTAVLTNIAMSLTAPTREEIDALMHALQRPRERQ